MDLAGYAFGRHFQLVVSRHDVIAVDAGAVADVTVADIFCDRVTPTAAGQPADPLAVAVDRLAAQQHHRGVGDCEPGEQLVHAGFGLPGERLAAEERHVRFQLHRPAQPGFERRVIGADIGAPGAVAFLQPQRLDGAVAGVGDAVRRARRHQPVVDIGGVRHRHMQLPAQLADIGHAQRGDRRAADGNFAHRAEGKTRPRYVVVAYRRQHIARLRPHQRQHRVGRRNIGQARVQPGRDVRPDPGEIVRREAGAGGDVKPVGGQPRHRQVAFDAAIRVQHLGVDQPARRPVDIVGADPGQRGLGVPALDHELGERALIEQADAFAHGPVFLADRGEPVLPAEAVFVARLDAVGREPVRPLPAELLAEAGAARFEPVVQRRAAQRAAACMFLGRPGDGVMLGVHFHGAGADPFDVAVRRAEAADIDGPQIVGRLAAGDPFGQRLAGAAAGRDPEGVEAGADEEADAFRRLAEDEIAVRGEALRPVDQLLDAGRLQRRHAAQRLFHHRLEMVPVLVEQREVEAVGNAVIGPGDRVRLVAAHHQPADFLLVVGQAVGVAQGRQVARHAVDRLGDQVLVLDRNQRHRHAGHPADFIGPLPGAIDDDLAFDAAPAGDDRTYPAVLHLDAGDVGILEDLHALAARAPGQRLGDIGGIGLAVGRQESGADDVRGVHDGPQFQRLRRRQQFHFQPETARHGGLAPDLGPAIRRAREPQPAIHLPAGRLPGFRLQPAIDLDRMPKQLRDIGVVAQLPDQARRVPGRTAGQLAGFDQHGVAPTLAGQMVGGRAADDAAADHHRSGPGRKIRHHIAWNSSCARSKRARFSVVYST